MSGSPSKFLADESCDFAVVRILRANGYDVVAVAEYMHRNIPITCLARLLSLNPDASVLSKNQKWLESQ